MKNKKLNLSDLKVTSFVTSIEKNSQATVKGGNDAAVTPGCGNSFDQCPTVPVNDCYIRSYNADCPTVPVAECDASDVNTCFTIVIRPTIVNCLVG